MYIYTTKLRRIKYYNHIVGNHRNCTVAICIAWFNMVHYGLTIGATRC